MYSKTAMRIKRGSLLGMMRGILSLTDAQIMAKASIMKACMSVIA